MDIYLSVGVSALVALMAAHRAADGRDGTTPAIFNQEDVTRIRASLSDAAPP